MSIPTRSARTVREQGVELTLGACLVGASVTLGVLAAVAPLLAVGGALALAVALAAYAYPRLAMLAAVAVLPTLPGLARGLVVPGLRITEIAAVALALLAFQRVRRRPMPAITSVEWLAVAFVLAAVLLGVLNLIRHEIPVDGAALGTILGPVQFVLMMFAIRFLVVHRDDVQDIVRVLVWSSVPVAVAATLQFLDVPGLRALIIALTGSDTAPTPGQGDNVRATGLFSHWHSLGGYLCLVIILVAALLLRGGVIRRSHLVGILAVDTAALVCTATFVALAGTALGVLLLAALHGRLRRTALVMTGLTVLAAPVALPIFADRLNQQFESAKPVYRIDQSTYPFLPQTIGFRMEVWLDQYLPALEPYLLLGWGASVPPGVRWEYTESVYITLLVRGGLVLLVLYLALMVAALRLAARLRASDLPLLPEVMAVGIVTFGVMQLTNPYFTDAGFPQMWWLCLGVLLSQPFRQPITLTSGKVDHAQPSAH